MHAERRSGGPSAALRGAAADEAWAYFHERQEAERRRDRALAAAAAAGGSGSSSGSSGSGSWGGRLAAAAETPRARSRSRSPGSGGRAAALESKIDLAESILGQVRSNLAVFLGPTLTQRLDDIVVETTAEAIARDAVDESASETDEERDEDRAEAHASHADAPMSPGERAMAALEDVTYEGSTIAPEDETEGSVVDDIDAQSTIIVAADEESVPRATAPGAVALASASADAGRFASSRTGIDYRALLSSTLGLDEAGPPSAADFAHPGPVLASWTRAEEDEKAVQRAAAKAYWDGRAAQDAAAQDAQTPAADEPSPEASPTARTAAPRPAVPSPRTPDRGASTSPIPALSPQYDVLEQDAPPAGVHRQPVFTPGKPPRTPAASALPSSPIVNAFLARSDSSEEAQAPRVAATPSRDAFRDASRSPPPSSPPRAVLADESRDRMAAMRQVVHDSPTLNSVSSTSSSSSASPSPARVTPPARLPQTASPAKAKIDQLRATLFAKSGYLSPRSTASPASSPPGSSPRDVMLASLQDRVRKLSLGTGASPKEQMRGAQRSTADNSLLARAGAMSAAAAAHRPSPMAAAAERERVLSMERALSMVDRSSDASSLSASPVARVSRLRRDLGVGDAPVSSSPASPASRFSSAPLPLVPGSARRRAADEAAAAAPRATGAFDARRIVAPPAAPVLTSVTHASVVVSWQEAAVDARAMGLERPRYALYVCRGMAAFPDPESMAPLYTGPDVCFCHNGLAADAVYRYAVMLDCDEAVSPLSREAGTRTTPLLVLPTPAPVDFKLIFPTSVTVVWRPPPAGAAAEPVSYRLFRAAVRAGGVADLDEHATAVYTGSEPVFFDTGLQPGAVYAYAVQFVSARGKSRVGPTKPISTPTQ